jgi:hypothetical protein
MPDGTVCKRCNSYFGETLDPVIVTDPPVALAIQMLGLPGKKGPRQKVGPVRRVGRKVVLQIDEPAIDDGSATLSISRDYTFVPTKFSRALHCIAFNIMTCNMGPAHSRKPHFDKVRQFIRAPVPGDFWPWIRHIEALDPIRPEVRGRLVPDAPGEAVLVRLFNADYYVDLLNRGGLQLWADSTIGAKATAFTKDTEFHIRPRSQTWRQNMSKDEDSPDDAT